MDHPGLRETPGTTQDGRRGGGGEVGVGSEVRAHLRARAESVEHVEEDEAGEGHGGVPGSDHVVLQLNTHTHTHSLWLYTHRKTGGQQTGSDLTHLPPEDEERAADDDERRQQHLDQQAAGDDAVLDVAGGLRDDIAVHGLHPQTDKREAPPISC